MSPNMKLSVLAFAGAAAAFPQYNHGHSFHKHSTPVAGAGHAYPTGGWGSGGNSTVTPLPTGTGSPSGPSGPSGPSEYEVTTITESDYTITSTITSTVYSTQYPSGSSPSDVAAQDVSSSAEGLCGRGQTVYVTETNRVTVTVPAGGASSAAPAVPSSSSPAPAVSAPGSGYEVPEAKPSSAAAVETPEVEPTSFVLATPTPTPSPSPVEEKPTSAAAVETPAPSEEAVSSAAPASSVKESSAPATSPSSTPSTGYTGGKRGLAYRWDGAADAKSFAEKATFGFAWNWESDSRGDIGGTSFIPTLRTLENAGDWSEKANAAIAAGSKVVFGLNEPDISTQANLDVGALCQAWTEHMNPLSKNGVTVVGPSVSSSQEAGQGLEYLQNFIDACPGAKFTDINIHWYGGASDTFEIFKEHVEKAASQFPDRKIWVSEYGLQGATPEQSADFLKESLPYLDGNDRVAGYSYFAVGNFDAAFNLLGSASALSKTGEVYCS